MLVTFTLLALSGAAVPHADAAGGSISGTVSGAPSHSPVAEVEACASKIEHEGEFSEGKEHCGFSAPDGGYEIESLEAGLYVVVFWPRGKGQNYLPASYDPDHVWPADAVAVGSGAVTGIDTELAEAGSITGRVSDEVGGGPLAGVVVCATESWEERGERRCDVTGADGRYLLVGLLNLEYTVEFSATKGGLHYFDERWQDQIVGNGYPQTLVPVTEGHVSSGIDAALKPSAEIRGVVSAAADGRGLGQILVCAAPPKSFGEDQFADHARCVRTDGSGVYSIGNLEAGQYTVAFSLEMREFVHWLPPLEPEEDGFPTRYWSEKDGWWESDPVSLAAPTVAAGIDARLGPGPPPRPAPPAPPAPQPAPRAVKPKCRHGLRLRKVRGKRRCVHPHRRRHRRAGSAAASSAGAAAHRPGGLILLTGRGIDLLDPADGRVREVSKRGGEPAFIPSRRAFAYIGAGGGCAPAGHGSCFTEYSVFVKSLKGRNPGEPGRRLFGWKRFFVREVDVSPAGRLVFAAKPGPGPDGERLDIYSSNLAGRHVRRLTRDPAFENDPVVSPDGRRIAFARKVHGRAQIFTMRIDGSHQVRLTDDGRRDRLPSWSPDGRRLVFISQPGGHDAFGRRDVRTVTTGGVERTLATVGRGDVDHPVYSPDGRWIAFLRSGNVWLMSARGHHKRLLRRGREIYEYEGGVDWGR